MFEHRRKRRQLQSAIEELDAGVESRLIEMKDKRPEQVALTGLVTADYQTRRHHLEMELEVLEARHLLDKAARWGVEGSAPQELYDPKYVGLEPQPYFKPQYKEQMRTMIADARRKRIKEWVDILGPTLTLMISLIALIVSIIALLRS